MPPPFSIDTRFSTDRGALPLSFLRHKPTPSLQTPPSSFSTHSFVDLFFIFSILPPSLSNPPSSSLSSSRDSAHSFWRLELHSLKSIHDIHYRNSLIISTSSTLSILRLASSDLTCKSFLWCCSLTQDQVAVQYQFIFLGLCRPSTRYRQINLSTSDSYTSGFILRIWSLSFYLLV